MLEFAIGSAVLMSAFTGSYQFGYLFYRYNALENAVNAGARYASLRPYDSSTTTPSAAFASAVKNVVVYGAPAGGTTAVLPGLTTSNVNFSVNPFVHGVPSTMSVSISGYTVNAIFTSITFTNKPKVTYAYQGIYSPY